MLCFNFNTTKTINHLVNKLTNFNYSDYFKEQNKQNIRKNITRVLFLRKI